jgi:hypothetical protein
MGVAVEGPSREGFYFYPVYHLSDGTLDYGREPKLPHILTNGESHRWALDYRPSESGRPGRLQTMLDDECGTVEIPKLPAHSTVFDRFGIVTTWIDGNSQHVYFDDLTYTVRQ